MPNEWEFSNENQSWVNISALCKGDLFAMVPQLADLIKELLANDPLINEDDINIVFPSDEEWRNKIYYRLVEKQRNYNISKNENQNNNEMLNTSQSSDSFSSQKMHEWKTLPEKKNSTLQQKHLVAQDQVSSDLTSYRSVTNSDRIITSRGSADLNWTISDIAKAACLLATPQKICKFEDEHEMRRVYTLIYDVFRYKNVLSQALQDTGFFQMFDKLQTSAAHVWLLLFDLYHRGFQERDTAVAPMVVKLFKNADILFAENALWTHRVKLAAAVARLRIKHKALTLNDLLPNHLKDNVCKKQSCNNPVTCWVNNKKVRNPNEICKHIENTFQCTLVEEDIELGPRNFKWDKHCPLIIVFHPSMRGTLAQSTLVKNHKLIVQDKSFCLGPAVFWKTVGDLGLSGSVIQTHINSPRSTAYLATLLAQNDRIRKLLVFSAGTRKEEIESYLKQLGMNNVIVFSDKLIDIVPESPYLEEVVAVFATPPNSYSAVRDPVDLVCSRGGDLSMLEALTASEQSEEGKVRVSQILEEQRKTLKYSMSKAQIQLVLYQTHSYLEMENKDMVQKAITEINRTAKLHHAARKHGENIAQQIRTAAQQDQTELQKDASSNKIRPNSSITFKEKDNLKRRKLITNYEESEYSSEDDSEQNLKVNASITKEEQHLIEDVPVPDTDLFDTPELPNLCPTDSSIDLLKEGCYLALLQRKEVIRLDHKYMIEMAETRGIFGNKSQSNLKDKTSKEKKNRERTQEVKKKSKRKIGQIEEGPFSEESSEGDEDLSILDDSILHRSADGDISYRSVKSNTSKLNLNAACKMLDHLNSFQVRQLVSSSYNGGTRKFFEKWMKRSKEARKRREKREKEARMRLQKKQEQIDKANREYFKSKSALFDKDSDLIANTKISKNKLSKEQVSVLINRLTEPTQSMIVRKIKEEEFPLEPRGPDGHLKHAFICEHCRKRNQLMATKENPVGKVFRKR